MTRSPRRIGAALPLAWIVGCASLVGIDDPSFIGEDSGVDGGGADAVSVDANGPVDAAADGLPMDADALDGSALDAPDGRVEASVADASNLDGGDTGTADTGCQGTAGPTPVPAGSFCIDSTEVTVAQYELFLDAGANVSQPPACAWNTDFRPDAGAWAGEGLPVTFVDWCDARAYCQWAGKHLCRLTDGGAGDMLPYRTVADEWYSACGGGSSDAGYPYGADYMEGACWVDDGGLRSVGAAAACLGGYPGLLDMSGNAAEWTDECANDRCWARGGSADGTSWNGSGWGGCGYAQAVPSWLQGDQIGFRCCSGRE